MLRLIVIGKLNWKIEALSSLGRIKLVQVAAQTAEDEFVVGVRNVRS